MIKAGLALDDRQMAEEARRMQLGKINTKNPYKKDKDRPQVWYFENP